VIEIAASDSDSRIDDQRAQVAWTSNQCAAH